MRARGLRIANERRTRGGATELLAVLAGFLLLCTAALLAASRAEPPADVNSAEQTARLQDNARSAFDAAARADLALRRSNYGEAQVQLGRALAHLERTVKQSDAEHQPKP